MTEEKINAYLISKSNFFPAESIPMIKEKMLNANDSAFTMLMSLDLKSPTTVTIISVLLGSAGIDRFLLGDAGMGILKLLTGGVCGIMTIYDWFTIGQKAKQQNLNKIMTIL